MTYERQFIVGRTYLTKEGKQVKIIAENTRYGPHYCCVQGDDGTDAIEDITFLVKGRNQVFELIPANKRGWRYDRASDAGRCTGSKAMTDPRNLVVGSEQV